MGSLKRGDLVTVAASGDYGKPRPAVIIQSDWLDGTESVLVCLVTTTLRDAPLFRLPVTPNEANGLQAASQIMLDKIVAVRRDKCGKEIGRLDDEILITLNRMLALVTGIAD